MDSSETVTHVSLCAGYGGIDLGLKRAIRGVRTIAFSEIEAYACANLVAKMEAGLLDAAPIWTNVKTFPYVQLRYCVDVLSGGYPCQPFSSAGKRQGIYDQRHLWPWIATGIDGMQPGLCFFENVEGHVSLGLSTVIADLEELGYTATWGLFSAAEVGAPHQRKRVFILAYRDNAGLEGWDGRILPECSCELPSWPGRPSEPQHNWEPPRIVGDSEELLGDGSHDIARICPRDESFSELRNTGRASGLGDTECTGLAGLSGGWLPSSRRTQTEPSCGYEGGKETEPPMGRVPYGRSYRVDELRLLGNGVVPATAERAFRTLLARFVTPHTA